MEDNKIIELYFDRSEQAIRETDAKYGGYCFSIAYNILTNREDAEECVSDTYWDAWNAIPPTRPRLLAAFLGKITRCISIDRWRRRAAGKRGSGEFELALDELRDCAAPGEGVEEALLRKENALALNRFLQSLPQMEREILMCRYWYMDSVPEIAKNSGFSESKVTSMLHRSRGKLRTFLQKEGLQ